MEKRLVLTVATFFALLGLILGSPALQENGARIPENPLGINIPLKPFSTKGTVNLTSIIEAQQKVIADTVFENLFIKLLEEEELHSLFSDCDGKEQEPGKEVHQLQKRGFNIKTLFKKISKILKKALDILKVICSIVGSRAQNSSSTFSMICQKLRPSN